MQEGTDIYTLTIDPEFYIIESETLLCTLAIQGYESDNSAEQGTFVRIACYDIMYHYGEIYRNFCLHRELISEGKRRVIVYLIYKTLSDTMLS